MKDIDDAILEALKGKGLTDEQDLEKDLMTQGYEWEEIFDALQDMVNSGDISTSTDYWVNDDD